MSFSTQSAPLHYTNKLNRKDEMSRSDRASQPHILLRQLALSASIAAMLTSISALSWAQSSPPSTDARYIDRDAGPRGGQLRILAGPGDPAQLGLKEPGYQLLYLERAEDPSLLLHRGALAAQLGLYDSLALGLGMSADFGDYGGVNNPWASAQYTHRRGDAASFGVRLTYVPRFSDRDGWQLQLAMPARWRINERFSLDSAPTFSINHEDLLWQGVSAHLRATWQVNEAFYTGAQTELNFRGFVAQTHLPLWLNAGYTIKLSPQQHMDLTLRAGWPGGYYFFYERSFDLRRLQAHLGFTLYFDELWST